jgi:hypothetical protein
MTLEKVRWKKSVQDKSTHVLKEYFENTTGFFIDQTRDTLHTTTACKATDSWFGDTCSACKRTLKERQALDKP